MITLQDLGLAYRKAKVDLFYSSSVPLLALAAYEEDLHNNLTQLLDRINGEDESWVTTPGFIGTWTLAPKTIKMAAWENYCKDHGNGLIFASPADEWKHICDLLSETEGQKKPEAEFRVMAKCSIDFHVLSTLWIIRVGTKFDEKLADSAYGNRLRRTKEGEFSELSLGSFSPYLKPFRNWRDRGIETMRTALDAGKQIIALTADITSFYHELNIGFMGADDFIESVMQVELDDEEQKLHRLFIQAVEAWAESTPLKKGLPVGLPASAVVANVALIKLDRIIEREVVPLYYGRYVDDILLIMENGGRFHSTASLWKWLFDRSDQTLSWVPEEETKQICFTPSYLTVNQRPSRIHFANKKNKVFMLAGEPGKRLVDSIAHEIHERASEWRAMPRLPFSAEHVGTNLLAATQQDGEIADNLRKADALTMRRAGFAIKLRDFEAYERDLHPSDWAAHRLAFFDAVIEHVLVLPKFFDLASYLPRIIRLATACEDFASLRKILDVIDALCKQIREDCTVVVKAQSASEKKSRSGQLLGCWENELFTTIRESIAASFPPRLSQKGKHEWAVHMNDYSPNVQSFNVILDWIQLESFQEQQQRLFSHDLAHVPFRFAGLRRGLVSKRGIPAKKTHTTCVESKSILPENIVDGCEILAKWTKLKGLPHGLLFATRPFNVPELCLLNREFYALPDPDELNKIIVAIRGFKLETMLPQINDGLLRIPTEAKDSASSQKCAIAVSSWKTSMRSWTASVCQMRDPDVTRYTRLCRLLDDVITNPQKSRYFILPELALPASWFMRIARKLQGCGISIITGIEYLHSRKKSTVQNQVWAALSYDGLGFPSTLIIRQDKQQAAQHEERELYDLAGLAMKPQRSFDNGCPTIIQHGELRFAMLICSELTNIQYRAALRGKVDALFVPEWNQDTESFNALVESAALDIHAYIIQCNDRQYGDSRIRAPYKDRWKRDILRVKGGINDYCVIGEIDAQALRRFQSNFRSPDGPFKPVPDGFEIEGGRRVLPAGGKE